MNNFFANKNLRKLHRDFGYFFVGLILAFCVSGIMLNHRTTWNPVRYKYDFIKVQSSFHLPKESVTSEDVKAFNDKNQIPDFQTFNFRGDSTLIILYKSADATIHLADGNGEINVWKQRPILSRLYYLHSAFTDDNWYKWYSDIFALGLIFIASTGMFLMRGKYSFRKRGWMFALAGIVMPIIALILFG